MEDKWHCFSPGRLLQFVAEPDNSSSSGTRARQQRFFCTYQWSGDGEIQDLRGIRRGSTWPYQRPATLRGWSHDKTSR